MNYKKIIQFILVVFTLATATSIHQTAQAGPSDNAKGQKVLAALITRFTGFVAWPDGAIGDQFVIGVCDHNDLKSVIEGATKGKGVSGRSIVVKSLSASPSASDIQSCQILVIPDKNSGNTSSILAAAKGSPVLLVSDAEGFASNGGMIGLNQAGGKIKLEVNRGQLESEGLKAGAQLLKVATIVD